MIKGQHHQLLLRACWIEIRFLIFIKASISDEQCKMQINTRLKTRILIRILLSPGARPAWEFHMFSDLHNLLPIMVISLQQHHHSVILLVSSNLRHYVFELKTGQRNKFKKKGKSRLSRPWQIMQIGYTCQILTPAWHRKKEICQSKFEFSTEC